MVAVYHRVTLFVTTNVEVVLACDAHAGGFKGSTHHEHGTLSTAALESSSLGLAKWLAQSLENHQFELWGLATAFGGWGCALNRREARHDYEQSCSYRTSSFGDNDSLSLKGFGHKLAVRREGELHCGRLRRCQPLGEVNQYCTWH